MRLWRHGNQIVAKAPAKLNLFLKVLARRGDGFHDLETVMVPTGLADHLIFQLLPAEHAGSVEFRQIVVRRRAATNQAACDVTVIPHGSENLVVRAAELLRDSADSISSLPGIRITLVKRLPAGAGLGGGSSDAAATLLALNTIWQLGQPTSQLLELGAQLGSDVNFFVAGGRTAICRGRGELIQSIKVAAGSPVVIVQPSTGLSTPAVFKECTPSTVGPAANDFAQELKNTPRTALVKSLHNTLEPPARQLNAEVDRVQSALQLQGVVSHLMSGSGSACFGVCRSHRQARCVAGRLRAQRVGRVWYTHLKP